MRPIRTVLRLDAEGDISKREIARRSGISRPAVTEYLSRAKMAGISWPGCEELNDQQLEERLFGGLTSAGPRHPQPNWQDVYEAMQLKGATLQCLHQEYTQEYPNGMGYTRFCQVYRKFERAQKATMYLEHNPGETAYVDFAGATIQIQPDGDGEPFKVQLFVGVLGCSGLVFARACRTQKIPDWLAMHQAMLRRWGGVPRTIIPDNLKAAVTKASYRGEPEIASAYLELSNHYGFNIVPARPYQPRDKAKAERAVLSITRWIVFALRKETFSTISQLNEAIDDRIAAMNQKNIRRLGKSRTQLFEESERAALQPLPAGSWEYSEHRKYVVGVDYHIEIDNHTYSVPYTLIGEQVLVRSTANTVDISHRGNHVASHARAYSPGHTTNPQHRHPRHTAYLNWSAEEALEMATALGQVCAELLAKIFAQDKHIDHQRRASQAISRMAREYGQQRLQNACLLALNLKEYNMTFVRNLLRNHREALPLTGTEGSTVITEHPNLRSKAEFSIHIVPKRRTNVPE